jgi:hypothetical protein
MILLDRKKPISALKLIHTFNHTQPIRLCDIHSGHSDLIKILDYTIGERIYNLQAGLYKVIFGKKEYIIDVYFDLSNGDFLIIKNKDNITLYMAGSTPYPIIPYEINSIKNIQNNHNIKTVNDSIDIITVAGKTRYAGSTSPGMPMDINRTSSIIVETNSGNNSDSLYIPLKYTLGELSNGARDYVVINTDQLIAHNIINTSKEILSGSLDWEYKEEYSDSDYYVFFTKYPNVKYNNSPDSIRCSHFESISCDSLLNKSVKGNYIATSFDKYDNGLWIKINKDILDIHGDKNFGREMKKWILAQAISDSPIYIEYEISNTIYDTILIDEYHIKTWHPNTTVTAYNCNGISLFYKSFKP